MGNITAMQIIFKYPTLIADSTKSEYYFPSCKFAIVKKNYDKVDVQIRHNEILFPKGYYFSQSSISKELKITANQINEININTYPVSLVVNNSEVIFLKVDCQDELEKFADLNKISVKERVDIWALLNEPFLDTEFEEIDKVNTVNSLVLNGIPKDEIKHIRKKINKTMWKNALAWEWVYLGLYDYLHWTILTKRKYRWAMEIALRNYQKQ